jgi:hypothetical protein
LNCGLKTELQPDRAACGLPRRARAGQLYKQTQLAGVTRAKQSQFQKESKVSSCRFEAGEPRVEPSESSYFELYPSNFRRTAGGTSCTNKPNSKRSLESEVSSVKQAKPTAGSSNFPLYTSHKLPVVQTKPIPSAWSNFVHPAVTVLGRDGWHRKGIQARRIRWHRHPADDSWAGSPCHLRPSEGRDSQVLGGKRVMVNRSCMPNKANSR